VGSGKSLSGLNFGYCVNFGICYFCYVCYFGDFWVVFWGGEAGKLNVLMGMVVIESSLNRPVC